MAKASKPSLNVMIMTAMETLRDEQSHEYVTARQVRDQIALADTIHYPIQTIIVVLNRFAAKGVINRRMVGSKQVRQRYLYYLVSNSDSIRQERMVEQFQAFADEFCQGNVQHALVEAESAMNAAAEQTQQIKASIQTRSASNAVSIEPKHSRGREAKQ